MLLDVLIITLLSYRVCLDLVKPGTNQVDLMSDSIQCGERACYYSY